MMPYLDDVQGKLAQLYCCFSLQVPQPVIAALFVLILCLRRTRCDTWLTRYVILHPIVWPENNATDDNTA
jgi:hypothetical protein